MSNSDARQQALEVHDAFEVEPTSLISYRSRGSILAFGDPAALARCADLPPGLEIQQASTDGCRVLIEGDDEFAELLAFYEGRTLPTR